MNYRNTTQTVHKLAFLPQFRRSLPPIQEGAFTDPAFKKHIASEKSFFLQILEISALFFHSRQETLHFFVTLAARHSCPLQGTGSPMSPTAGAGLGAAESLCRRLPLPLLTLLPPLPTPFAEISGKSHHEGSGVLAGPDRHGQ